MFTFFGKKENIIEEGLYASQNNSTGNIQHLLKREERMTSYRLFHITRILATYMEPRGPLAEVLNRESLLCPPIFCRARLPQISATRPSYRREWTG